MYVRDIIRLQWDISQRWRVIEGHLLRTKEFVDRERARVEERVRMKAAEAYTQALDEWCPGWRERHRPLEEPSTEPEDVPSERRIEADFLAAFRLHGPALERVGRMIFSLEGRRNSLIRELERYREGRSRQTARPAPHAIEFGRNGRPQNGKR